MVLDAAFWVACLVLVAAGTTKLVDPDPSAAALRTVLAGRAPAATPRLLGAAEVLVGVAGLAWGGSVVAAVAALLYLAFAVVVLAARRRGVASCGCFGERSGPPSPLHVALNLASAGVCLAAAAVSVPAVADAGLGLAALWVLPVVLVAAAGVIAVQTR